MLYQLWFGDKLWENLTGQDVDISVLLLILLLWGSITWGLNGTYRQRLQKKETNPTVQLGWKHWQGPYTPMAQSALFLRKFYVFKMAYASFQRWWNFQSGQFVNQCVWLCTYVEFFPEEFIVIGHSAVHLLLKLVDRKGRVLPVGARRASQ